MANAFEELEARLRLDASEFRDGVNQATDDLDNLEQKSSDARKAIAGFGAAAGAAAVGGIKASIDAAASFEDQMTKSMAVVGDVSDDMRGQLEGAARDVARTTVHSAEDAAEAYYFLASAGLDAEQQLEAMPQVADFAAAGAIEMGEATDYATDIMAAFGYEADELNRVTDTLTATFSNHNQTAEQMGTAMSYVAPVASEMGVAIEETSAAIGMMGDAGIKGSKAGTALRQALASLTSPSAKQAELLEELGVQATDSEGNLRDFTSIIRGLEQAGISSGQVMELFGTQAGPGMQVLLSQGADALEENTSKIEGMGGVTEEVAKNQMQSFSAQAEILRSNIRDLGISVGQVLLPPLTTLMSAFTGVIQRFGELNDRFDGLPATIGLASTAIGGFGAAALALQGTAIAALVPSLGAVAVAAGTVGTAIAATGAVIGAAAGAWRSNFGGIREFTEMHMSNTAAAVRTWTSEVANTLEDDVARISAIWSDLVTSLSQATRRALAVTNRIIGQISGAWEGAGIDTIAIINSTAEQIVNRFEWLATTVGTVVRSGVERFITFWNDHGEAVIETVSSFVGRLTQLFRDFVGRVTQIWNRISEPVTNVISGIVQKGFELAERFGLISDSSDTMGQKLADLVPSIIGLLNPVTRAIGIVNRISEIWTENWGGIQEKTTSAIDSVTETLGKVDEQLVQPGLESITRLFGTEGGTWDTTATETFDSIETTFTESFATLKETTTTALSDVTTEWQTHEEDVGIAMEDLLTTLREAFGQITEEILPQFVGFFGRIFGRFTDSIEELWEAHAGQLTGEFALLAEELLGHLDTLVAGFMRVWELFGDEILAVAEFIFSIILGVFKTFADGLLTALATLSALFRGDWEAALNYVSGFFGRTFDGMLDWIKEWGGRFLSWLGGLVGDVIDWFKDLAYRLVGGSVVPDMFDDILEVAEGFGGDLLRWIVTMADRFVRRVTDWKDDFVEEVEDMVDDAHSEITSAASRFKSAGKSLVTSVAGGIRDKISEVKDAADEVADKIRERLPSSDAETGPLSDLEAASTALPETLSEEMLSQIRQVSRASDLLAEAAHPRPAANAAATQTQAQTQTPTVQTENSYEVVFDTDGSAEESLLNLILEEAEVFVREQNDRRSRRRPRPSR